jgi:Xaa-Pro aminopeptidase
MAAVSIHAERRRRAALALARPGPRLRLDCLMVGGSENIRYLSGFTGSNALMLIFTDGRSFLYTDPRYTIQAARQCDCKVKVAKRDLFKSLIRDFDKSMTRSIGIEKDHTTVGLEQVLKKILPTRATIEPVAGLIEKQRMVKDEGEIELIRKSVDLNSAAFDAALKKIKPGITETDVAAEIDYRSRKLGADGPAFATIVAAGERVALPHAQPGRTKIAPGMLLIDMGAFREGYASDMTRMIHIGKAPAQYKQAYKAVLESQLAAIDAVKPGVSAKAVDAVTRETLKKHGYEKEFVHSTGHGLGLEIHEAPRVGRKEGTKLEAGMVITIEPGIYIEGWGGIRIEDTVLVTPNGCEVLTPTSKELLEM